MIADGRKTIETRTWQTPHRGDLLICASKRPIVDNLPTGAALAIVELLDCRPMTAADEPAACCAIYPKAFAWLLRNPRPLPRPLPVIGKLKMFDVDLEALQHHLPPPGASREQPERSVDATRGRSASENRIQPPLS